MSRPFAREALPEFPPIQASDGINLSAHRVSISDGSPVYVRNSRPFVDFDTDMIETAGDSSAAMTSAVSPDDPDIGDDLYDTKTDVKLKSKHAAIPDYLGSKRTKDGKVPKKRGPKPDSKPARDRRQELNRQAQRNHRQRKEENQKMLEDAVADSTEKRMAALKRVHAAEEIQQRLLQGQEQLLRENERLKQLLDVNKIPYEHVIPQQDTQPTTAIRPANTIQQRGNLVSGSVSSEDASVGKGSTDRASRNVVSPGTSMPAMPPFVMSSPSDVTLSGMSLDSSSSPVSPTERTNRAVPATGGTLLHEYNLNSSGQQPILNVGQTSDALTGKPSGSILGPGPAVASAPPASAAYNCSVAPGVPPYQVSQNASTVAMFPGSSINADDNSSSPLKDTSDCPVRSQGRYAIPDHDQAGAEFILALEANCHDHKTLMNALTFSEPAQLGGHSLMLTRVPVNVAKTYHMGDAPHPHGFPEVGEGPGKWARMLGLVSLKPYSSNKDWATQSGEISPAQALGMIRKDPRYPILDARDFTRLTNNLKDRCRCYGFGAVIEVYEVQDALDDIAAEKGCGPEDGYGLDDPLWSQIPLSHPHTMNGPEFPALDGLMDFDIAALMRDRHTEREQFIAADLRSFKTATSTAGEPASDPYVEDNQAPSVAPPDGNIPAYSQMPAYNF